MSQHAPKRRCCPTFSALACGVPILWGPVFGRTCWTGDSKAFPAIAARPPSHVTAASSLSICCRLKSHLFSLFYPNSRLFSHLYSIYPDSDSSFWTLSLLHFCMRRLLGTWLTTGRLSLTLPLGAIYVPPFVVTYTRSATQSLYLWPSGFFRCRPGCLELSVWRNPWTVASCGQFQTVT